MTPEELVVKLQKASRSGLRSVILYGSAVAGDHVGKRSDYNVLVVTERLGLDELKALSGPAVEWVRKGNPPPLLFTLDRLQKSADVFPIELLDIQDCHRILAGENVLQEIRVERENLRLQLERELKSNLIRLRERYLLVASHPRRVVELLVESLSSFLVLFRAALRLYQPQVPQVKLEALAQLSHHLHFDLQVFRTVEEIKEGKKKPREVDADLLFERYLHNIETMTDAIDQYIHGQESLTDPS